ncbi:MAG: hypothetical protein HDT42_11505 [Ruminococcaceae bacterium]|nr:hypothetical protein [Oscillospiraceae bacterium]
MKSEIINIRPDARVKSNGCSGTLEREEWRDIKGYEGLYQVSSFGRVKSLVGASRYETYMILSPYNAKGYKRVNLYRNGKVSKIFVHRLVAEAFIPNPDNLPQVNHRSEKPDCNYPDNLEWCTQQYNNLYGTRLKKIGEKKRGQKNSEISKEKNRDAKRDKMKPVLQYTLDGGFVAEYESQRAAQRKTGINNSHIGLCAQGERKTAGGFIWRYKD